MGTAQESGEVSFPGGVHEIMDVALKDMVQMAILVVGGQLDKIILEVFSNLDDSMLL